MPDEITPQPKEVITVKEMAALLHLSRSRLHMLIKEGVFLPPLHDTKTRRPFFPRSIIDLNLDARRRNCGVNGRPICFYAPRAASIAPTRPAPSRRQPTNASSRSRHAELIEGLAALGMTATEAQIDAALLAAFPTDRGASADDGLRLRECYRSLRHSNAVEHSAHNVSR